jgi:hypothetical protein
MEAVLFLDWPIGKTVQLVEVEAVSIPAAEHDPAA